MTYHGGMNRFEKRRRRMAEAQLAARHVAAPVTDAMAAVPREEFLPPALREFAYEDRALPIGEGQTISQPYVVARMLALAEPEPAGRALEVGAGCGYAAAVLSRLCAEVYAVERHEALAGAAKATLARLGFDNVDIVHGDGAQGLPEQAPFDVIIVSASAAAAPDALREQLAPGGRLVMPVGRRGYQILTRVTRTGPGSFHTEKFDEVVFVPLVSGGDACP